MNYIFFIRKPLKLARKWEEGPSLMLKMVERAKEKMKRYRHFWQWATNSKNMLNRRSLREDKDLPSKLTEHITLFPQPEAAPGNFYWGGWGKFWRG